LPKAKKTLAKVVDDCAVALQKLVRVKAAVAARANGMVQCVTCNQWGHYKEMDGGHYFSRKDKAVKLLEENIHPQCKGCNLKMGHGDTKVTESYRRFMVDTYGEGMLAELETMAWGVAKFDRSDIEQLTKDIQAKIRELEKQL